MKNNKETSSRAERLRREKSYEGVKHRLERSERVRKVFAEVGRTKPEFKDACSVKRILQKYAGLGIKPQPDPNRDYGNYVDVPTFHDAMNIVVNSENRFNSLDPKIRKRFGNSPLAMLEFLADPDNVSEAIELGLLKDDVSRQQESPGASSVISEGKETEEESE